MKWGLFKSFNADEYLKDEGEEQKARLRLVLRQAEVLNVWLRWFRIWTVTQNVLVVVSIILSTLIAAQPFGWEGTTYKKLAWSLAAITAIIGFLNPGDKGSRLRRAWTVLGVAITRYKTNKAHSAEYVVRAYETGEAIIHQEPDKPDKASEPDSTQTQAQQEQRTQQP